EQDREALIRQLEAERARFETVVEQVPAGMIIAEAPSGRILYSNTQWRELWGRDVPHPQSTEEYNSSFQGTRKSGRAYKPEDWPMARSLLRGERVLNEEAQIELPSGQRTTVLISSSPIRDRDGKVV